MFTLWNWLFLGLWVFSTISISVWIYVANKRYKNGAILNFVISLFVVAVIMGGIAWYNTNTASGIRNLKDFQSDFGNGIDREITITAEDGREIFYYDGKVDVESNHEDNYIKFESEDGKRYIVYYGIQDTIKIIEK